MDVDGYPLLAGFFSCDFSTSWTSRFVVIFVPYLSPTVVAAMRILPSTNGHVFCIIDYYFTIKLNYKVLQLLINNAKNKTSSSTE